MQMLVNCTQNLNFFLRQGCRILDLGCGSGRDSKYFSGKGYDVVAVDPSPTMCRKTAEYAGVTTSMMRAEDLSFESDMMRYGHVRLCCIF